MPSFRSTYRDIPRPPDPLVEGEDPSPGKALEKVQRGLLHQVRYFVAAVGGLGVITLFSLLAGAFWFGQQTAARPLPVAELPAHGLSVLREELAHSETAKQALTFEVELLRERLDAADEDHRQRTAAALKALRAETAEQKLQIREAQTAFEEAVTRRITAVRSLAKTLRDLESDWSELSDAGNEEASAVIWAALQSRMPPASELSGPLEDLDDLDLQTVASLPEWVELMSRLQELHTRILHSAVHFEVALTQVRQVTAALAQTTHREDDPTPVPLRPEPASHRGESPVTKADRLTTNPPATGREIRP